MTRTNLTQEIGLGIFSRQLQSESPQGHRIRIGMDGCHCETILGPPGRKIGDRLACHAWNSAGVDRVKVGDQMR